jgi:hypothetical protein
MVLNCSELPEFRLTNNESKYFKDIEIPIIINSIRKFYEDTNFKYFFENNIREYEKIINDYPNKECIKKETNCIFKYLGIDDKCYTIIISPLVLGNYGLRSEKMNYIIISPIGYDYLEDKYDFGTVNDIKNILIHEICHPVIDNLTNVYIDHFKIKDKKAPENFMQHAYGDMDVVISEYIIRAITNLLEKDENFGKQLLEEDIETGFKDIEKVKIFIKKNCEKNGKFTKERNYKKLLSYIIELLEQSHCA